ncbi:uncharacterized protein [Triticum aestivum]|uniref:uncharacterized protein n=1 Tax=Triticum aestivum TaxID=4565 RepID=UPI001D02097A|nr:uncharacterized protein LOC123147147 [Triticum aestivum]
MVDEGEVQAMGLKQLLLDYYHGDTAIMGDEVRDGETGIMRSSTIQRWSFEMRQRPRSRIENYKPLVWPSCSHGDKGLEVVRSMLKKATDKPIEDAYLEAFRRLPADAMPDLVECAYLGGHCIGILDPVSNIILNSLNLLCRRRAGIYSPPEYQIPPGPINPHIRNTWSGIAFDSYCALLAFMQVYFRYLSQEQARFYIHLSGGDLLVAICIAEMELRQSTTTMQENHIAVCHSGLFRDRAKLGLRIAAIKVNHPTPDDLLLLFQEQPTESMRSLLLTLEEGRCLGLDDVETFLKILHYQHLMVPHDLHLTLPHAPSSGTDSGSCPRYCFNLNGQGSSMAATLTFQRQTTFNLANMRSSKTIFSKIRSSIHLFPGFHMHTPMEVADAAPTCQHIESIKMSLMDTIHAFYVEALAKLPSSHPQRLLRGILVAGHCYGLLDPVSNIIIHAVWYDAIMPPRHDACYEIQPDILGATTLRRLELSSLDGLIAAVRATTDFSEHKAVQYLRAIRCDLSLMSVMWQSTDKCARVFRHASKAANHPLKEHHISSLGFLFEPHTASILTKILTDGGNPLCDASVTKLHLVCKEKLSLPLYGISQKNIVMARLPDITAMKQRLEQKQVFLHGELDELLRLYAIQHPWEPLYNLEMICGVEEHRSYSYCYHVNFLAVPEGSAPRVLFFAQLRMSRSQSEQSGGGSFCCPLPYYDADNPFPGRCSMCEASMGKIIHPASGAHIGPVHTEPTSTVDYVYVTAPMSMKCYQTDMDDLVESELTYCTESLDYFST